MVLDAKTILKNSVGQLLDSRPDISRLNLSRQMHVADGTLGRIQYGNGNPTVDTIEAIARFFRLQPWQLLIEDFDRDAPPQVISPEHTPDGLTEDERELIRVLRILREPERSYLFKQAKNYMESMEGRHETADKSQLVERNGTNDRPASEEHPLWGTW
ncbi:helix-turn-helix transcriptional regulator [Alcaligenaceae bacterium]|nr:helix-turn-helix transcriptional regulator [Alcaligenaceae bacterium]